MERRYSRHTMLREIGEAGQARLHASSVLVVGVGGLGSPIALYLAAAGVGRIGLIDGDVVSESNLQRQVLYSESEVGLPKVECARRRLEGLNSGVEVEIYNERLGEENGADIISRYDIVVDGCDNIATRYLIDSLCGSLGRPYVYGSIGEFTGQVSLFHYQGAGGYSELYPYDETMNRDTVAGGVMGVVPGVVGSLEACEVIKVLVGCGETLAGRLLMVNLLTMDIDVITLR